MRLICAIAVLALGCQQVDSDRPTAPRHDDVVAAYAQPSGSLTAESAVEIIAALEARLDELNTLLSLYGAVAELPSVLGDPGPTEASEDGLEVRRHALTLEAGGWAKIIRKCPLSGELVAFALFGEGGLEEDLWGEAAACALEDAEGVVHQFDGDLWLRLADGAEEVLFLFEGEATKAGERAPFALDLQATQTAVLLRQPVEAGTFLIGVALDDTTEIRVRDRQGDWRCDLTECSGPDGERFDR